jgi:hypothetical protein
MNEEIKTNTLSDTEKEILGTCLTFCMDCDLADSLTDIVGEEVTDKDIENLLEKLTKEKN